MLFRWLQHALPHSVSVCTILRRQCFLSSQHCFHPLAIFPMNRCSYPSFVCCWYCCGIFLSNNKSNIVLSIVDPLGLPFQSSPLCVSPSSNVTSIPASKRFRRWFGTSISLTICTDVSLCSRWASLLLGHRSMWRTVSTSPPSQHWHLAGMLSFNQCARAFVYQCCVYCFEKCALAIELLPNFLALFAVISSAAWY